MGSEALSRFPQGGPAHWFEEAREVGLAQTLERTRGIDRERRSTSAGGCARHLPSERGYTVVAEGIETKDELEAAT